MFNGIFRYTRKLIIKKHRNYCINKMNFDIDSQRLVWVDLEMTGLDINTDTILEVACIVTDSDLNILAEGPNLIIQTPEEKLNAMGPWCIKQHSKTGLTEAAKTSNVSIHQAEDSILDFLSNHITKGFCPLAGNSVYMDKIFLQKYMPRLNEQLHYRIVDCSTIKELCRRWNPDLYKKVPKKEFTHRALNDIKESINEMKFYKEHFFKTNI